MEFSIRDRGQAGYSILISCLGDDDTGGGLFAFDGTQVEAIDRVSSTGLFVADGRLFRTLWTHGSGAVGEILVYDHRGVERYHRIDVLSDPHDLIWDGKHLVAVSSAKNSIFWIAASGEVVNEWRAPGEDDSWHMNSLLVRDGRILVCAFGRYGSSRQWKDRVQAGDGVLFDLETGADVITGLCAPHTPRYCDGCWVICNSAKSELLQISDKTGLVLRRAELQLWTRGIAICDDFVFVGESANRNISTGQTASLAVLSRHDWNLLGRFVLPRREIYDLVVVPAELVEGVRAGFRTNPVRTAEQDQLWLFQQLGITPTRIWATGDPLSPEDCKVKLEVSIPEVWQASRMASLECSITNKGSAIFVSYPPNPIHLSYRWLPISSGVPVDNAEGIRTRLPRALLPENRVNCRMQVAAPAAEGQYLLRITLVQEHVAWFDDLDENNSYCRLVHVGP